MGVREATPYERELADGNNYTITLDTPAIAGSRLVVMAGGGSRCLEARLEDAAGTLFDLRTDAYVTGNNDVAVHDLIVPPGGCTDVWLLLNGPDQNAGLIVELEDSPAFIGAERSGGTTGDVIAAATDFRAESPTPVTVPADTQAFVLTVSTIESTLSGAPYSNPANRWTQMEPSGVLVGQGAVQPGSGTQFIWSVGIADAGAGEYTGATTFHNGGGRRFYTAVAAYENTGTPANTAVSPIVRENRRPGSPRAQWFPGVVGWTGAISGYQDKQSYLPGDTVEFKVDSDELDFEVFVYRLGFYGHEEVGARNVLGPSGSITGTPAAQPAPSVDPVLGHTTCAWSTTASWDVPVDAVSGVYLYHVVRDDDPANRSTGHFVVRDASVADMDVVIIPDSTYQAYNVWGNPTDEGPRGPGGTWTGRSLYQIGNDLGVPNFGHRAYAVSWDRPMATGRTHPNTYLWDGDFPLWLFLEAQGANLTYVSDTDLDADPTLLAGANLVVPTGHMEYVSERIWDALRSAQTSGINMLSHGSNCALWHTRHPDSRTMICYKDGGSVDDRAGFDGGTGLDPLGYTGTWRDTRGFLNIDQRPESVLYKQIFVANAPAAKQLTVPHSHQGLPLWRNSPDVQALDVGEVYTTPTAVYGDEGDWVDERFVSPDNFVQLCPTEVDLTSGANLNGTVYVTPYTDITVGFTLHRDPSGALIMHTGSWRGFEGISRWARNDYAAVVTTPNLNWQSMVLAVFYDLGGRPATVRPLRLEDAAPTDPATGAPTGSRDDIAIAYGLTVGRAYVGWGIPI